ncbi:autotransporter outer membrane beta-barrel domain-containing protein [Candidatus Thioglobus sp.]
MLAVLPSRFDRTSGRINGGGASSGDESNIESPVWFRISGGKRDIDSASSTTGSDFQTNHWQTQIGADFTLAEDSQGSFVLGVNAGYGGAQTDISSTAGNSKIDTDSYSLGLSGTWLMADNIYVDLQAQKSWYSTDLSAGGTGAGAVNDVDGDGYSASIEVGQAIALSEVLQITPQAQLAYAKVDTEAFTGANAEVVSASNGKSLKLRLGAQLDKQLSADGDGVTNGFIIANVIHEFEGDTQVTVSGTKLSNSVDQWSGELGGGIKHAWDEGTMHYETFAAITAGTSLNNFGDSNSVQLELGLKAKF